MFAVVVVRLAPALCALGALGFAGCARSPPPPPQTAVAAPAPPATTNKPPTGPATPPGPPAGAPLRLYPAAEARSLLLASIAIPSLDRTLAGAVALLTRAVPLPLDAAGVKEALLTQAGLPAKVGENLDTGSPAGGVVVATGGKDVAGLVMAIPAKGVEQARVVIGALGTVVARRGEVLQIDNGAGGRGWVWQSGDIIVLSDSVDALGRGAMLALDARRSGVGEDLTAVLYPEPIARANGTDLKTALSTAVSMLRAARAAQIAPAQKDGKGGKTKGAVEGAGIDHSLDVVEDIAGYIGDTNTLEVGLTMDDVRGLVANLRVHPVAGTPFEKLTAEGRPFVIDPALLRRTDDVAFVMASSYGPFLATQIARQRKRLEESHDKGAAAALQFLDAWFAALEGSWSGVGRLTPGLSFQLVYPIKDDANAAKLGAAMLKLDTAAALAVWKTQVAPDQQGWFDWRLKKETVGKVPAMHYILGFNVKALRAAGRDAVKRVLGGSALDVYAGVVGTRMVVTAGKDAKAKLLELSREFQAAAAAVARDDKKTGAKEGTKLVAGPNGDLTDATVAARGKDSFAYFDFAQITGVVAALVDEPRAKMLAASCAAPIPTYVTFSNDSQAKQMTFTWTLPPAAFVGAGAILQGLSGSGSMK